MSDKKNRQVKSILNRSVSLGIRNRGYGNRPWKPEDDVLGKRRAMEEIDTAEWIGVDLDGTLIEDTGWKGSRHFGKPIPRMINRVKRWLKQGRRVKIFTARANPMIDTEEESYSDRMFFLRKWIMETFGCELEITYEKDMYMTELWDDRVVQLELNTGRRVDGKA